MVIDCNDYNDGNCDCKDCPNFFYMKKICCIHCEHIYPCGVMCGLVANIYREGGEVNVPL